MNNVVCECCYVKHGWIRFCNCKKGATRTDTENPFGLTEPYIKSTMGRNEKDMVLTKDILIDAIIGRGFHSMQFADEMVKKGLARYTGSNWIENWEWRRELLEKMEIHKLENLYKLAKS